MGNYKPSYEIEANVIFKAIAQDVMPNETVIFGKLDDSDWSYHDASFVERLDKTLHYESMDFLVRFKREIGSPITVSICKAFNSFYVICQEMTYISLDSIELFVRETINRFIELEKRKVEIHGESLA